MFSCFFVFGKKVSANENQNAAPIITYYGLNGNDITIQWKSPDGVSYSKVDIYSATSPNGSYHYENTVSGNSYTNTYVIKGVPYYYKLEASYEDNDGYKTATTYAGKCIINPLPAPSFSPVPPYTTLRTDIGTAFYRPPEVLSQPWPPIVSPLVCVYSLPVFP